MKDIWMEKARNIMSKLDLHDFVSFKVEEEIISLFAGALEEVARGKDLEVDKAVAIGWKISKQLSEKEARIKELEKFLEFYKNKWEAEISLTRSMLDSPLYKIIEENNSLSQKLEKAVQGFKMLVDRASMKTDDYYAKYPDYKKKIMKDSSPYSGELQTAKYFLKELSEDK